MAQIVFYLKSEAPDKTGRVSILAQITVNYKVYRLKLGKVHPKDWNKKAKRLKLTGIPPKKEEDNIAINTLLDNVERKAKDLFIKVMQEKRKPTDLELKKLLVLSDERQEEKQKTFFEVFEEFIEVNRIDKASRTITGYITVRNFLKNFERDTKYRLTWDNLNLKFIDNLKKYTFLTLKKQTGYLSKIARVTSTCLRWAEDRGYYKGGNIYKELKIAEPEKDIIFLQMEELLLLFNYDFGKARLNKVRDLYCFSCFTGLRFSDVVSLKREHVNGMMFTKTQQKTTQLNSVPLNNFALEIIKRNEGNTNLLPGISSVKINEYIKECCGIIAKTQTPLSGFNRLVVKKQVIGREIKENMIPLHKAITFHTARKTFITNSIMLGVNIKALQDMGAPKNDKDLKKYLKITDAFKTEVMDNSWNKIRVS